ncbi:MAG: SDR family NAD(P)-dependent oxidoreductase [bacterium]|nr:SDR family NAD(P)-dependent oxidoreductase [bacterium]
MALDGRTVLVSGMGAGFGREVVESALSSDANVALAPCTESTWAETAKQLDPVRKRVAYQPCDVGQPGACENLVAHGVDRRFSRYLLVSPLRIPHQMNGSVFATGATAVVATPRVARSLPSRRIACSMRSGLREAQRDPDRNRPGNIQPFRAGPEDVFWHTIRSRPSKTRCRADLPSHRPA